MRQIEVEAVGILEIADDWTEQDIKNHICSLPSLTVDWTQDETKPIVSGDVEKLKPIFEKYCAWGSDGFWRTEPRHVEKIREVHRSNRFRLFEILPKRPSSPTGRSAPSRPSDGGGTPTTARQGHQEEGKPSGASAVAGTIERVFPTIKGGKSMAMITLARTSGKFEAGCWNKTVYEILGKNLGKHAEIITETRGKYTNVTGLRTVAGVEYDEHNKPVIQQRDRQAGGQTLFP